MALEAKRLRAIIGGSAGNLVEWYDWYAYTSLSLYFAASFFPKGDATAQLLGTSAVFAVGFFMRPIGAYVMGRYADTRGRKAGLAVSVALMCAGSLMIAFVPSYASIGLAAPIILLRRADDPGACRSAANMARVPPICPKWRRGSIAASGRASNMSR